MNQNRVLENNGSAPAAFSQSTTPSFEFLQLDITGLASVCDWKVEALSWYVFHALLHLADPIRFKTLKEQTNDADLIYLFEAVSLARSYLAQGEDFDNRINVSHGLAEMHPVTQDVAFEHVCWALFNNAELLINTIYRKLDDPLADCYLAESLSIAVHYVKSQGVELSKDINNWVLCIAQEARAALIRSSLDTEFNSVAEASSVRGRLSRAGQGNRRSPVPA